MSSKKLCSESLALGGGVNTILSAFCPFASRVMCSSVQDTSAEVSELCTVLYRTRPQKYPSYVQFCTGHVHRSIRVMYGSVQDTTTEVSAIICEFHESCASVADCLDLWPHFALLLSGSGGALCKRSAHIGVQCVGLLNTQCCLACRFAEHFCTGSVCASTVTQCHILTVKNTLAKSVYCVMACTVCSIVGSVLAGLRKTTT
jgi:hypothetical protein